MKKENFETALGLTQLAKLSEYYLSSMRQLDLGFFTASEILIPTLRFIKEHSPENYEFIIANINDGVTKIGERAKKELEAL